ncbi:hypothetical protein ACKKBG_A00735 [Auxenochlorella protothecoides x Auxenochlorella symbiontica]
MVTFAAHPTRAHAPPAAGYHKLSARPHHRARYGRRAPSSPRADLVVDFPRLAAPAREWIAAHTPGWAGGFDGNAMNRILISDIVRPDPLTAAVVLAGLITVLNWGGEYAGRSIWVGLTERGQTGCHVHRPCPCGRRVTLPTPGCEQASACCPGCAGMTGTRAPRWPPTSARAWPGWRPSPPWHSGAAPAMSPSTEGCGTRVFEGGRGWGARRAAYGARPASPPEDGEGARRRSGQRTRAQRGRAAHGPRRGQSAADSAAVQRSGRSVGVLRMARADSPVHLKLSTTEGTRPAERTVAPAPGSSRPPRAPGSASSNVFIGSDSESVTHCSTAATGSRPSNSPCT